ncbi:MAG: hypothetical protein ABEK50_08015 [bacterium]
MWTIAFFIGVVLAGLVFLVGYGQVLLYNLILRSLLVMFGSALTIVAARKATAVFIKPPTTDVEKPPELGEVDIEGPSGETAETSEQTQETESVDDVEPDGPIETDEATSEIDDDADIGKLADMVSETMKEEE